MRLSNPICKYVGHCIDVCGMCGLRRGQIRTITKESLYFECRQLGFCVCGLCEEISREAIKQSSKLVIIKPKRPRGRPRKNLLPGEKRINKPDLHYYNDPQKPDLRKIRIIIFYED